MTAFFWQTPICLAVILLVNRPFLQPASPGDAGEEMECATQILSRGDFFAVCPPEKYSNPFQTHKSANWSKEKGKENGLLCIIHKFDAGRARKLLQKWIFRKEKSHNFWAKPGFGGLEPGIFEILYLQNCKIGCIIHPFQFLGRSPEYEKLRRIP